MELDKEWGMGCHNTGKNMKGEIMMKTRSKLKSGKIKPQASGPGAQAASNPPSYRSKVGGPQPTTTNSTAVPPQKVHPPAGPSANQKRTPAQVSHRSIPDESEVYIGTCIITHISLQTTLASQNISCWELQYCWPCK